MDFPDLLEPLAFQDPPACLGRKDQLANLVEQVSQVFKVIQEHQERLGYLETMVYLVGRDLLVIQVRRTTYP